MKPAKATKPAEPCPAFAGVEPSAAGAVRPTKGLRFDFLNGLRGLMALYVATRHAFLEVHARPDGPAFAHSVGPILLAIDSGKLAVDVFIVLSGFLLMLPIVRAGRTDMPSIGQFYRRRAFRILPPYYAALFVAILCILFVPGMGTPNGSHWDLSLRNWDSGGSLLSHLLLVHNLSWRYAYTINHAMWSMGTEVQLYLLFPLLMLPIWRRLGNLALALSMLMLGAAVYYALPQFEAARLWYVINFALGMAGATLLFSKDPVLEAVRRKTPWTLLVVGCMGLAVLAAMNRSVAKQHIWLPDAIVGFGTMCLMVLLARQQMESPNARRHPLRWMMECPPAMFLGKVSFSLFLMHPMVLAILSLWTRQTVNPSPAAHLLIMLGVGLPLSVGAAYVFYMAVERWFIPSKQEEAAKPRPAAAIESPQPGSMRPMPPTGLSV